MMNSVRKTLLLSTAVAVVLTQPGFVVQAAGPDELMIENMTQSHVSAQSSAFDDPIALQKQNEKLQRSVIAETLIKETEEGKVASSLLTNMQDTILRMNDLSYNLVKGGGKFLEFSTNEMENLQKEGWVIRSFTGLEGDRSTFEDLSGIVCYNRAQNVITVVYHGTANNAEGWETNFDGQLVKGNQIQKVMTKDLFEETRATLKAVAEKSNITELKTFLKSKMKSEEFGKDTIVQAQQMVEKLMAENKLEAEIGNDMLHQFKMKLDICDYLEKTGCKIEGDVHSGFAKKYYSTKQEVMCLLKEFVDTMTPEQKKNVKVVFSGHSQAGGTGNLALADIAANHGKELFGSGFDNKNSGTFNGYFLSAARAGTKDFVKWAHDYVGQDNIARQNVAGDPVPIAAVDSEMGKFVRKNLPAAGKILSKEASGYADTGHLLYQDWREGEKLARACYETDGVSIEDFKTLDTAIHDVLSNVLDEKDIPEALITYKSNRSSWNPFNAFSKLSNLWSAKGTIQAALKDEHMKAKLENLFERRLAYFHLGHYKEGVGATFDPRVVDRNLNGMLKRGAEQDQYKAAQRAEAKKLEKEEARAKYLKVSKKDN